MLQEVTVPETANLIPKETSGGIISMTTLIARKLDPQRIDNVMSAIHIFDCFKI